MQVIEINELFCEISNEESALINGGNNAKFDIDRYLKSRSISEILPPGPGVTNLEALLNQAIGWKKPESDDD